MDRTEIDTNRKFQVLKFGGTSVGSAANIRQVIDIVQQSDAPLVLVLSATSGTTNALVELNQLWSSREIGACFKLLDQVETRHMELAYDLLNTPDKVHRKIRSLISELRSFVTQPFNDVLARRVLVQGEMLSTTLVNEVLLEAGVATQWLPALDFMTLDEYGQPDQETIAQRLEIAFGDLPSGQVYVTQGYACRNHAGEVDNLKRGGSDYTATLIGAALKAEEIQIWTDIDGLHSNDPRYVEGTRPVARLSFAEAASLAHFGAKILHPECVLPASRSKVPIRLKNTMAPAAQGTLIQDVAHQGSVRAIAAKDELTLLQLSIPTHVPVFLGYERIFKVLAEYGVSSDLVVASEHTVSVVLENASLENSLLDKLEKWSLVEKESEVSAICIVGGAGRQSSGYADKILGPLQEIPIKLIGYGSNGHGVYLVVSSQDKRRALQNLQDSLFTQKKTRFATA